MVQVVPADPGWGGVGEALGGLAVHGYTHYSDQSALQKALADLPKGASGDEMVKALMNTKTYSNKAKETAIGNIVKQEDIRAATAKRDQDNAIRKQEEERHLAEETRKVAEEKRKNETLTLDKQKELREQGKAVVEQAKLQKKEADERERAKSLAKQINGLTPEQQEVFGNSASVDTIETILKDQLKEDKKLSKKDTKRNYNALIGTLDSMIDLGKKGNLGRGSGFKSFFGGETAKDFGRYSQLAKYVLTAGSSLVIRNQKEFETMAHGLLDPTLADSERQGYLEGLKEVIQRERDENEAVDNAKPGEEINISGLPDPAQFAGKKITSPDGKVFRSDGTKWVK